MSAWCAQKPRRISVAQESMELAVQDTEHLPIGSTVVPFCVLYLGSYRVIAKRNYYGAYG